MTMREFAEYVQQAERGHPAPVAQQFLAHLPADAGSLAVAERLLDAATWGPQDWAPFNAREPLLVRGVWGLFWLVPEGWRLALLPPAPRISLRGLHCLAKGLTEVLK